MCTALGVLKWSPETYRSATFYEYTAAMKGHLISSGVDITQPPSKQEINEAFKAHDERVKASMGVR